MSHILKTKCSNTKYIKENILIYNLLHVNMRLKEFL